MEQPGCWRGCAAGAAARLWLVRTGSAPPGRWLTTAPPALFSSYDQRHTTHPKGSSRRLPSRLSPRASKPTSCRIFLTLGYLFLEPCIACRLATRTRPSVRLPSRADLDACLLQHTPNRLSDKARAMLSAPITLEEFKMCGRTSKFAAAWCSYPIGTRACAAVSVK